MDKTKVEWSAAISAGDNELADRIDKYHP